MKAADLVIGKEYEINKDILKYVGNDVNGDPLFECDKDHNWSKNKDGLIPFFNNGSCMKLLKPSPTEP